MLRAVLLASSCAASLLAAAPVLADTPTSPARHKTEIVWVDPVKDVAQDARTSHISHTLFVNRCVGGCTISPGNNDARSNESSITQSTRTITEFNLGDEVFDAAIACLRDVYEPYAVEITTTDPGTTIFHHEAILAGYPEEMGRDSLTGGVAPASCEPLNNVISFSFANSLGESQSGDQLVETLCWTMAQESAHSFGLPNHVFDCMDPMTYLPGPCGRKYFRNRGIECGEFQPGACTCGGSVQNSHAELVATFGPGEGVDPPVVSIVLPAENAQVGDNFSIFFTAIDKRTVQYIDVYLNGTRYASIPGKTDFSSADDPYSAEAPAHPDGYIDLELVAVSEVGVEGRATQTVLKGAPCANDDACFDHMSCSDGRCSYPPPEGELGDGCDYDQYCLSGLCGDGVCTVTCTAGVQGSCPEGLGECTSEGFCSGGDSGGCCTVAGGKDRPSRFPLVELSLFAAVFGFLHLRRRRRAV